MIMKILLLFLTLNILFLNSGIGQENAFAPNKKGNLYLFWGWNRANYSQSDIHFWGNNYNFTLDNVVARDRQSPFSTRIYLNPKNLTIPQTNLRIGYYFKDKYQVSVAVDHMKYVMVNDQTVNMTGEIANGMGYDGSYNATPTQLTRDFLLFEHTDGLNYLNSEIRRSDVLYTKKWFTISSQYGAGLGVLMPKTNCTLMDFNRNDEFHIAGFGVSAVGALNFNFFKYFFIQAEFKSGFIAMPDIRTTEFKVDRASQHFGFLEYVGCFGFNYPLK